MQAFEYSRSASRDVAQNIRTCNDGTSSSSVEDGLGGTVLVDVTVCGKIGPRTEGCDLHRSGGVTHATVPVAIFILVDLLVPHLAKSSVDIFLSTGVIYLSLSPRGI